MLCTHNNRISTHKKPINHKSLIGKPMLFAITRKFKLPKGTSYLQYNIMTGDYIIFGQKNSPVPYAIKNIKKAVHLLAIIDHYNETDEILKKSDVSHVSINDLIEIEQ